MNYGAFYWHGLCKNNPSSSGMFHIRRNSNFLLQNFVFMFFLPRNLRSFGILYSSFVLSWHTSENSLDWKNVSSMSASLSLILKACDIGTFCLDKSGLIEICSSFCFIIVVL